MKIRIIHSLALTLTFLLSAAHAAIITVNTENNTDFSAGKTNLYLALSLANTNGAAANTINFNIAGAGPFHIKTPTNGYPMITNHDITINGYSQPGSSPNSNPIHAANNAQIKIVLDSRIDPASTDVLGTDMDYANGASNAGFGNGDVGILGLFRATNTTISGLCFLGQFSANYDMYCVAVAGDEGGTSYNCHVAGCWFGVDVDETSVVGNCVSAIAVARHRNPGNTYQITSDRFTLGVAAGSANPRAEFNVALGMIETINIEANYGRISGNFLGVYPAGNRCWIGPIDGVPLGIGDNWRECHIEIGRANNNTVIGSDLDGVNDDQEGNVIGGTVDNVLWPQSPGYTGLRGYTHSIEFYGNNNTIAGTNYGPGSVIIANNYCGVGVDGTTRFTNGVPFSDGNPPTSRIEGNVIFNNYPTNIFDPTLASTKGFYDGTPNVVSARKNKMVNNYPYPANAGLAKYYQIYTKALAVAPTTASEVQPVITNGTTGRLRGTVPVSNASYPATIIDVYIPDPEGMANGMLANDPTEPDGWVQGLTYLGSPANKSSTPGTFDLDITSFGLPVGSQVTLTANYSGTNGILTSPFAAPATLTSYIPGSPSFAGLSYVVPDMSVWYNRNQLPGQPFPGYVTNGPVDPAAQLPTQVPGFAANGNWEPYVSVLGDSTFLVGSGQFADDGSWNNSTNLIGSRPNQRYVVTLQPATGGPPRNGEVFYDDFGQPYRLHTMMRQRNPSVRVAGDKRYGAQNFIDGGTAALLYGRLWFGIDYFNTDGRYSTNYPLYGTGFGSMNNQDGSGNPPGTTDFQSVSVQNFSLNPLTLAQTPLTRAFDATYGLSWRNSTPIEFCNAAGLPCGNGGAGSDNQAYFGGELAALDNGNFVVVVNDYTGFFAPTRIALPSTVATIVRPDGTVVKDTWLVDPREIWSNIAAYRGGFCVRVQTLLYFYNNAGNPTATNAVVSGTVTGGGAFDQGRGDGTRIASDIRSHYVYLAGPIAIPGGVGVGVAIWNGQNGAFITNAIVSSDLDPTLASADRTGVAVDTLDRVCVAFNGKADKTALGSQNQVIARVLQFDGTKVTYLTPSFFPFRSADSSDNVPARGILGYKTENPNVAMTTRQICIATKCTINSTNNPDGGPDTAPETIAYTVISHPAPVAAPRPQMDVIQSGTNALISWLADAGLFVLQSSSAVSPTSWSDVSPQPAIVRIGSGDANDRYQMTVPVGTGNRFFRLLRRW